MIPAGVGCDLVEIDRVEKSARNEAFLRRVYTEAELAYAGGRAETLAGMFAAKEALSKAVGAGLSGVSLRETEVCRAKSGQPYLVLHGRTAERFGEMTFFLSISHDRTAAMAVVTAFRPEGPEENGSGKENAV